MNRPLRTPPRQRQRGLSLVELMVGITVGLFVVAAATALVANQLTDNRRLLLETQIQQDMRTSMDIITRQLRRASANTLSSVESSVAAGPDSGGQRNGFTDVAGDNFFFYFDAAQQGRFGFRRSTIAGGIGVVQTYVPRVGFVGGNFQDLTDSKTLNVTAFTITPRTLTSERLPCPKPCPGPGAADACWPQVVVRDFVVEMTGEARSDTTVKRSLRNEVRVRNDVVTYAGAGAPVCPT